ncbi:unnamed protein product [Somion occarium]|uniref:Uncharacterized protein n=1 Tax=Somion occarium TaxID=3059160 RepID=A0ABP1D2L8_9APHY
MSSKLIPRPLNADLPAVRTALGMEYTRFSDWKDDVRKIAAEHLELDRPLSRQTSRHWKRFLKAVCKQFPRLMRFEDQWPLRIYMIKYLGQTTHRCKHSSGSPPRVKRHKNRKQTSAERRVRFVPPKSEEVQDYALSMRATMSAEPTQGDNRRHTTGAVETDTEVTENDAEVINNDITRSLEEIIKSPASISAGLSILRAVEPEPLSFGAPEVDKLDTFLLILDPALLEIADQLRKVGIRRETDLIRAFHFPQKTRDLFFQVDAGLSKYHFTLLEEALKDGERRETYSF